VTCLAPLLLSWGLLALSTSGLPTKALWPATDLQLRAAMASKVSIPGAMRVICRSVSQDGCPYAVHAREQAAQGLIFFGGWAPDQALQEAGSVPTVFLTNFECLAWWEKGLFRCSLSIA
jgi:hypothetical protein